jgi:hypothetical protein
MSSHPGPGRDRREAQSVVVHLVGLCGLLERGWDSTRSRAAMRRLMGRDGLPVLSVFPVPPSLTVESMVDARDAGDYHERALRWAQAVWRAFASQQDTIRALLPPPAG